MATVTDRRYTAEVLRVAYLFERFPSFGQTFCYREVVELIRQGADVTVFSIRRPNETVAESWDTEILRRVTYLPDEAQLRKEVERIRQLPADVAGLIKGWDRKPDFLRLYQAAWIAPHLERAGLQRVHAHFAGMAARTAYWIKQFFGIPYSFTAHANDIFAPRDFAVSLEKLFQEATAIVTVSDFAVEHLKKRFPQSAPKIYRVYNGIEIVPAAKIENTPPLILSIGRLIEKKGFADLISACERLKSSGKNFRCRIIGEGPLEEALRAQIAGAQLQDCVELAGPKPQSEIVVALAQASVFVLAARPAADGDMDNLPTVIMEAMAAGLTVISTRLAGIPEMVQPGVTGELVPPGDVAALSDAIEAIISNPDKARRMGEQGRELAAQEFSLATNVRALIRILQQPA